MNISFICIQLELSWKYKQMGRLSDDTLDIMKHRIEDWQIQYEANPREWIIKNNVIDSLNWDSVRSSALLILEISDFKVTQENLNLS